MILRSGYFWPSIFKDTFEHMNSCHIYQTSANRERNPVMPLQPVYEIHPFAKWGLDFIGLVNPPSSNGHIFILIATNYCMQWTKVETFRNCTTKVVIEFLEEHIVTRFKMPFALMCNNWSTFASAFLTQWAFKNQVIIKFSSNCYLQGNKVTKSINKNLITVIRQLLKENPRDWHMQLKYALWIDQVRFKNSLGTSPYLLIYGQELVFPLNLRIPILKFMSGYAEDVDRVQIRLMNLLEMDENQTTALEHMAKHQVVVKRWFDKRACNQIIQDF